MTQVNILADSRLRKKLCSRLQKTFNCKTVFGCELACPFRIAEMTQYGMSEKNLSLGEAYRLSLRQSIDKEKGRAIIRDAIMNRHEKYPEKSLDMIYKETLNDACTVCQVLMDFRRKFEQGRKDKSRPK